MLREYRPDRRSVIAALYVDPKGVYAGLPDVDVWDEARDARLYDGPWPVVAHPPCARWCQLASVNEARWGAKVGEDGGCFAAALEAVRRFGGVLEHPAYSIAWQHFGLPVPGRHGWTSSLLDDGLTTEVTQAAYGHEARKRTWLYYVGPTPPVLKWGDPRGDAVIGAGIHSGECVGRTKLVGKAASATPVKFRDVLIRMASGAPLIV